MSEIPLPKVGTDVPDEGLSIGETAAELGLPVETLRYYDRAGLLLDPTRVTRVGGGGTAPPISRGSRDS
jgi:hypothetical protein